MSILNTLRKIGFFNKRIKLIKPLIEDILYTFFEKEMKIVFFDIGGNEGQTIDYVQKIYKNAFVYSFEPTPELYDKLKVKYSKKPNIHISNNALSDKNEEIEFYISKFSQTNSILKPNTEIYESFNHPLTETLRRSNKIKINSVKWDDWMRDNIEDEMVIDIAKIDTQGFEYNVILGGMNTLKNNVKLLYFEIQYLEFYKNAVPFYKIYEELYKNGFYFYRHLSYDSRNVYQIIESDVLFINSKFYPIA